MQITFSSAPSRTPIIQIKHKGLSLDIDPIVSIPNGVGGFNRGINSEITEGLITTARELYAYQGFSDIDFVMMVANAFLADWEVDELIQKLMELSNRMKQTQRNEQLYDR